MSMADDYSDGEVTETDIQISSHMGTPDISVDEYLTDDEELSDIKTNITYDLDSDVVENKPNKKKLEITRKAEIVLEKKMTKKEEKLQELEKSFVPHIENIELMIKGLDPKKHLIKKSIIDNDTKILCLLIKNGNITSSNYKCSNTKCNIKKIWLNKPIQLLIHRKNGIHNDLTPLNLELLCANCYMVEQGYELFKKQIKNTTFNCKYCNYPLIKFNNSRKKGGVCLACEKKLLNIAVEKDDQEYDKQVKQLYKDNDLLAENEIHKTKYFKEVSKFKTLPSKNTKNLNSLKLAEKSIIIECNTDIGDIKNIDDLISIKSIDSD